MAQITNFFAGANSGEGFRSLFGEIVDLENTYDLVVLKGGPGVGKNTFMREIGKTMEAAGTAVEYLWCSGDPDSLDGVVLPELRCAVVDGTAPHVVEPKYPAAVDRYLDLGRFYDLTAAKASAAEIKQRIRGYKAAYERAYRYLKAARQVELEGISAAAQKFPKERAMRRTEGIIGRELRACGNERGIVTRRFLGSVTCKGPVWRFDSADVLCSKVYELEDAWEQAGTLLERLRAAALERKWDCIACMSPEEPERMEHLLIPGLGLGFVSTRPGMRCGMKPYRRVRLDPLAEPDGKGRFRFQKRMAEALREEGISALRTAKEEHDRLEAIYNPYVDFDGVRATAALEAGRLLSWMG